MHFENISHIRQCPKLKGNEFLWQLLMYITMRSKLTNGFSVGIWECGWDGMKVKHSTVSQPL